MPLEVGFLETVPIRDVWPTENAAFTPWLQSHVGELDKALGLGLSNARSEVGAGDFRIDLVRKPTSATSAGTKSIGRSPPPASRGSSNGTDGSPRAAGSSATRFPPTARTKSTRRGCANSTRPPRL